MKDRFLKTASLFMLGLTLNGQPDFRTNFNDSGLDKVISNEAQRVIDVKTFGQYGHTGGMGSLGFTNEGATIYDIEAFVENAIYRHKRAEHAFGRPLEMHIDLPSYYTRITEGGEKIVVFNENTGEVIRQYFEKTEKEGIKSTLSICIVPPPGSTEESIIEVVDDVFMGRMGGLPRQILVENIDEISLTIDPEYMVMGEFYSSGGPVNYVPIELINHVNSHYVVLHQSLQNENDLFEFEGNFIPTFNIYNFGINSSDDMFQDSEVLFLKNTLMISDSIGTLNDKSESTRNFVSAYKMPVSAMFFLPESPKLPDDGRQADIGINPWDYNKIAAWAKMNSKADIIMIH